MHFLIVDFEFTMHQRYGRPRVWFPEIIEVGAVVTDGHGVLQDTVIMLSLNLSFGQESVKTVQVLRVYTNEILSKVFPLSKCCYHFGK